jgi:hypothetical protein
MMTSQAKDWEKGGFTHERFDHPMTKLPVIHGAKNLAYAEESALLTKIENQDKIIISLKD